MGERQIVEMNDIPDEQFITELIKRMFPHDMGFIFIRHVPVKRKHGHGHRQQNTTTWQSRLVSSYDNDAAVYRSLKVLVDSMEEDGLALPPTPAAPEE